MIAQDKISHLKAGALAAAYGAAVGLVIGLCVVVELMGMRAVPVVLVCMGIGALASSSSAGITKEKADAADNLIHPGMHGVEVADAVFTSAPGIAVCAALCSVAYLISTGAVQWAA